MSEMVSEGLPPHVEAWFEAVRRGDTGAFGVAPTGLDPSRVGRVLLGVVLTSQRLGHATLRETIPYLHPHPQDHEAQLVRAVLRNARTDDLFAQLAVS
jgi:hypothetical protein